MADDNAVYWNENCYRIVQKWYNYQTATDYCSSVNNKLAVIQSADQAHYLIEAFKYL